VLRIGESPSKRSSESQPIPSTDGTKHNHGHGQAHVEECVEPVGFVIHAATVGAPNTVMSFFFASWALHSKTPFVLLDPLLKRCQGAGVDLFCSASTFRNCRMRSRCRDFFFRCRSNLALSPFLCDMNSPLRVPGVGLAVANRPRSQSVSSFALSGGHTLLDIYHSWAETVTKGSPRKRLAATWVCSLTR
jgi:hypothetical protein